MVMADTLAVRVFWRLVNEKITTVAASVSFFVVLAVFPGLAALISIVAMFASPDETERLLAALSGVIPSEAAQFLKRHIGRLAQNGGNLEVSRNGPGVVPIIGFAILLWSANRGIRLCSARMIVCTNPPSSAAFSRSPHSPWRLLQVPSYSWFSVSLWWSCLHLHWEP